MAGRYERWRDTSSRHFHRFSLGEWKDRLARLGFVSASGFYYFSRAAHQAFDIAEFAAAPLLISKKVLGRWAPHPALLWPFRAWLRRYANEAPADTGAYLLVQASRP
jgi:hypothetical protein